MQGVRTAIDIDDGMRLLEAETAAEAGSDGERPPL
jgi:hypothetical protein